LSASRSRRLRRLPLISPRQWLRRAGLWGGAIVVALVAIAFARAADAAGHAFRYVNDVHPLWALGFIPAGLVLAVFMTRKVFPGAQGSGIPQVIAALHMTDPVLIDTLLSLRIAGGKVLITLLGLLCGASIGREGPTVQVGASIMNAAAKRLGLPAGKGRQAFVLAGGAAGVSAAFNTPLAGIVFAIEELAHSFEARTSGTVLTAVIVGGIVTLALAGNYTYFGVTSVDLPLGAGWLAVLICSVGGGLLGGGFSQILVLAASGLPGRAGRFLERRPLLVAGLCGLVLALLGIFSAGATYGTGYLQARSLVEGHAQVPNWFFALKLGATTASYISGIPGGIFAPSLAIGAGLGHALSGLLPHAPPAALVLLGMVGYFSGVVQAPITATVIVMEMTDNQAMTIPLMATSFLAFGISRLVCRRALYGALARRFVVAMHRQKAGREEEVSAFDPASTGLASDEAGGG
jgi:H+/Cl- antiporter ClcA